MPWHKTGHIGLPDKGETIKWLVLRCINQLLKQKYFLHCQIIRCFLVKGIFKKISILSAAEKLILGGKKVKP